MNKQKLILVHKSLSPVKVARLYSDAKWIFLGKEYIDRLKWEDALGVNNKINYKDELTNISYNLRNEYVKWAVNLGKDHWKQWEWWITRLAVRNNLGSAFYLYVCYLEIFKSILNKRSASLIVVSESWELLDIIDSHWNKDFIIIKPFYWQQYLKRFQYKCIEKFHFILAWSSFFLKNFYEYLLAVISRFNSYPKRDHLVNSKHVIIHTCVDYECFGDEGKFKDRYYPGMSEYFLEKGIKVTKLVWLYNIKKKNLFKIFRWLRENEESFLIPQDYYSLFDSFNSFIVILKSALFRFKKESCFFRGVDLSPLIEYEQRLQARSTYTAYLINQIKIISRWKELGYKIMAYVDTWEAKNCEIPALIAMKKYYPNCKTVAYQHAALLSPLMFLNYKTTIDEFEASPHADIGITNSKINKDFLLTEGFPENFVKLGPAFRFKYLEKQNREVSIDVEKKRILICLPDSISSACEMLEICYNAFSSYKINSTIWVKSHPMMNLILLRKKISFVWSENFQVVTGGIGEWLTKADIVIVNDSSVMVESVYRGIETIIIGKETDIDLIPLDVIKKSNLYKIIYNSGQLRDVIDNFYCKKGSDKRDQIINDFFEFDMTLLDEIFCV